MKEFTYEVVSQKIRVYFWMKKEIHSGIIESEMILNERTIKHKKMNNGVLLKIGSLYKHSYGKLIETKGQVFLERNLIYNSRMDVESKRKSYLPTYKVKVKIKEKGEIIKINGEKKEVNLTDVIIKKDKVDVIYH